MSRGRGRGGQIDTMAIGKSRVEERGEGGMTLIIFLLSWIQHILVFDTVAQIGNVNVCSDIYL